MSTRTKRYISLRDRYTLAEGADENVWVMNWGEEEWGEKADLLSIGLSRPSAAASARKRFPKLLALLALSSSLSSRDISILASFDGSENAVGIRWKPHPSIFSGLVARRRRGGEGSVGGVREYSAPTMWQMMRVGWGGKGELGYCRRKGQSSVYNFRIFLLRFPFPMNFPAFSIFSFLVCSHWQQKEWTLCLQNEYNVLLIK
jgi:hypothetical protein